MEVYSRCIAQSQLEGLYRVCGLPDTFQSWFLVTQLHVWMCLVRFKSEGRDGAALYKRLVTLFWNDVEHRMKLSGVRTCSMLQSIHLSVHGCKCC